MPIFEQTGAPSCRGRRRGSRRSIAGRWCRRRHSAGSTATPPPRGRRTGCSATAIAAAKSATRECTDHRHLAQDVGSTEKRSPAGAGRAARLRRLLLRSSTRAPGGPCRQAAIMASTASRRPRTPPRPRRRAGCAPSRRGPFERIVLGPGAVADALHAAADDHMPDHSVAVGCRRPLIRVLRCPSARAVQRRRRPALQRPNIAAPAAPIRAPPPRPPRCSPAAACPRRAAARYRPAPASPLAAVPHRQRAPDVEAGIQVFIGIDRGKIARAEPPQHAVHDAARPRRRSSRSRPA